MDPINSDNLKYYGQPDREEDIDIYSPFNISKENLESSLKPNVVELNISKNFAEAVNISKPKKTKKKSKENIFQKPISDKDVQQAGFDFSHISDKDENKPDVLIDDDRLSTNNDSHENINSEMYLNALASQSRQVNEPVSFPNPPNIQRPLLPQYRPNTPQPSVYQQMMAQQRLYTNFIGSRFSPNNQYVMLNHSNMIGSPIRQVDYTPNVNYSLTSTYNHRLQVVDTLFRFVMQILRTPEPPSLQQIETLKVMLDSLIVQKSSNG